MNAPAQPVPQVMPWLMPDKITEALWQARGHLEPVTKSENTDDPERSYGYLPADGVIAAGEVKAIGTPDELRARAGHENLEDAFVQLIGSEEGLHA